MLDREIIENLQLPFVSFRLFALEQSIKSGRTTELLEVLNRLSEVEDNYECQGLIPYALEAVKSRLTGNKAGGISTDNPADFLNSFAATTAEHQVNLIIGPVAQEPGRYQGVAAGMLKAAKNQAAGALVLSTFSRTWPEDKLELLKPMLFADSLSIRTNALQILIQKAPALITADLPKLLTSNEPRFRALAIQGLASIDMTEALAHFDYLLSSASSEKKLAALQISIHLPFNLICPLLIRHVAVEEDENILMKIGVLLASNPDADVPFRLWEIAVQSDAKKQVVVKKIIRLVCEEIKITGLMGDEESAYLARLQSWIYRHGAATMLREYIDLLSMASASQILEMETRLKMAMKNEGVREVFVEAQNWQVAEVAKNFIGRLLQPQAVQISEISKAKSFAEMNSDEQIRYVAMQEDPESSGITVVLPEILQNTDAHPDLAATAFRTALKTGRSGYVTVARSALNSGNANLQSAAMEYMAEFSPDALFVKLGQYLKSQDLRIRRTALRVLKKQDQEQALSSLKAMLLQKDPQLYHSAIACMVHFPFSSVRPMLLEFLQIFHSRELLNAGLCLFQANPDPESLYPLFRLQQQIKDDGENLIDGVIDSIAESLRLAGQLDGSFVLAAARVDWQRQYQLELDKLKSPAAYSLQMTFPEALNAFKVTSLDFINELYERYRGAFNLYFVIVAILFILAGVRMFWPAPSAAVKSKSGAVAQNNLTVDGMVTRVDRSGEKVFLTDQEGRKHLVLAPRGTWKSGMTNKRLKLKVTPFRVNQSGLIISQFQKMDE